MKTFKFEFVKLSLIWRCTNGPAHFISSTPLFFSSEWEEKLRVDWNERAAAPREQSSSWNQLKIDWMTAVPAENGGIDWLRLAFLLPAAVMGAAAPWAPPKEDKPSQQSIQGWVDEKKIDLWMGMKKSIYLFIQRGPAWRAAGWWAEWNEINWNYEIDEWNEAGRSQQFNQLHQFQSITNQNNFLFWICLIEWIDGWWICWWSRNGRRQNNNFLLSEEMNGQLFQQPQSNNPQQSILFSLQEKKKLICLCCFAGELKEYYNSIRFN